MQSPFLSSHLAARLWVGLWLASLSGSINYAGICVPAEAKPDSPYDYMLTFADALDMAKSARDRISQAPTKENDPIGSATETMLALKLGNRDYQCAATILAPYKGSHDESIKGSAEAAAMVFLALVELNKEFIGFYTKALDAGPDNLKLGSLVEQTAELGAKAHDIWETLPTAAILSTYSIVEADPSSGKLARFKLTSAQRSSILGKLSKMFGPGIQKGMQVGQLPLEVAAAALYGFLNDKKWKSRDPE